jgi:hypothetical protein
MRLKAHLTTSYAWEGKAGTAKSGIIHHLFQALRGFWQFCGSFWACFGSAIKKNGDVGLC